MAIFDAEWEWVLIALGVLGIGVLSGIALALYPAFKKNTMTKEQKAAVDSKHEARARDVDRV